jgi:hypothetical protein
MRLLTRQSLPQVWDQWGRSWLPHDPKREIANEAAFIAKTMSEFSQLADYYAY